MKTLTIREYLELPKEIKVKKGMSLEQYTEGLFSEIGSTGEYLRKNADLVTANPDKTQVPAANPKANPEANTGFEGIIKQVDDQLTELANKYIKIISDLSKSLPIERRADDPWLFSGKDKNSTFRRYGLGGVFRRLFGGDEGLRKSYGEGITNGSITLTEYNIILESIEDEVDLMTETIFKNILLDEGFGDWWKYMKRRFKKGQNYTPSDLDSPNYRPGNPRGAGWQTPASDKPTRGYSFLRGTNSSSKPAGPPTDSSWKKGFNITPTQAPAAAPEAQAAPAASASAPAPDPQAAQKIAKAIMDFKNEAMGIIRDAFMKHIGQVKPTENPKGYNIPGFEESHKPFKEMVGTGVVTGHEKVPQGTFNVWGADPKGNAYPSTSIGEPKKKKKRKK